MTFEFTGAALLPAAAVLVLHRIEGQIVDPLVLGRRVSLSPVAVFVSVAFFGWLWGVVGAVLEPAVTIVATTIFPADASGRPTIDGPAIRSQA